MNFSPSIHNIQQYSHALNHVTINFTLKALICVAIKVKKELCIK